MLSESEQKRSMSQTRRGLPPPVAATVRSELDVRPLTSLNRSAGAHKEGRRQSLGSHVPGGPRGPGKPGGPCEGIPGGPRQRI